MLTIVGRCTEHHVGQQPDRNGTRFLGHRLSLHDTDGHQLCHASRESCLLDDRDDPLDVLVSERRLLGQTGLDGQRTTMPCASSWWRSSAPVIWRRAPVRLIRLPAP